MENINLDNEESVSKKDKNSEQKASDIFDAPINDSDYDEDFDEAVTKEPGGNQGYGGSKLGSGADDNLQVSGSNLEGFGKEDSDNGSSGDMSKRGRGQSFGYGSGGYVSGGFQGEDGNRKGGVETGYGGGFGNQGKQPASGESGNNGRGESAGYDSGGYEKGKSDGGFADGKEETEDENK